MRDFGSPRVRPRVMIMVATDAVGGPGKGLFQFLTHAPRNAFDYLLCNFRRTGQFVDEARRRRLNLASLNQRTTFDPGLVVQARRVVVQHDINLVQTHGYKPNFVGLLLKAVCRRPWVAFAHGYTDESLKMRVYNRINRFVLRHADLIVSVSGAMTAALRKDGIPQDKVRTIYNAIEPGGVGPTTGPVGVKRRHGIESHQKVVGVVGRLNPEKGQLTFLRAMKKITQAVPNVTAVIVGEGQERKILEQYCEEHGLTERVVFTGYRDDVADYYQIFDVLVLPSRSEGLPNVLLEAMASGVPVVATRVGGIPEVIEKHNGLLVSTDDSAGLADRVIELLQDEELRKAIGERGKSSLYPRFAADRRARQILDVYTELLEAPRE